MTKKRLIPVLAAAAVLAVTALVWALLPTTGVFQAALGAVVRAPADHDVPLATVFDPAATHLVTPHVDLALGGAQFAESIGTAEARELGLPGPMTAPEGHEIVVTQLSTAVDNEPPFGESDEAGVALELGERSVPLDGIPDSGDVLAAPVPKDAPALLVVTDAERRFSVDLRAGARAEYVASFADGTSTHAVPEDVYDETINAENGSWIAGFGAEVSFELYRAAWLPEHGWAPDGKVWATVEFSARYQWSTQESATVIEWVLDPGGSVKVEAGGKTYQEVEDHTGEKSAQFIDYWTLFELPADTTKLTYTFKPKGKGSVKLKFPGDTQNLSVKSGAAAKDYTVDFAG